MKRLTERAAPPAGAAGESPLDAAARELASLTGQAAPESAAAEAPDAPEVPRLDAPPLRAVPPLSTPARPAAPLSSSSGPEPVGPFLVPGAGEPAADGAPDLVEQVDDGPEPGAKDDS